MLSLIAWFYGKIVDLRNYAYDRGVLDTFDLGARTISIGNITTGGTGKTPLVAYVAALLAERGEKVCVLTRGYGREDESRRVLVSDGEQILADFREAGDEPVELAQKLLGKAIVIADADRIGAGEWAKRKFEITAFVLDDGFQHRRVRRDVDIVCVDATEPFGGGKPLPKGRLREPVDNLSRADMVIVMDGQKDVSYWPLRHEIMRIAPEGTTFQAERVVKRITLLHSDEAPSANVDSPLFAFCGLAKPANFLGHLRQKGMDIVGIEAFGDHHRYTQRDIADLEKDARSAGATSLITTVKDAVKLDSIHFTMPYFVVEIELRIDDPERFARLL